MKWKKYEEIIVANNYMKYEFFYAYTTIKTKTRMHASSGKPGITR